MAEVDAVIKVEGKPKWGCPRRSRMAEVEAATEDEGEPEGGGRDDTGGRRQMWLNIDVDGSQRGEARDDATGWRLRKGTGYSIQGGAQGGGGATRHRADADEWEEESSRRREAREE